MLTIDLETPLERQLVFYKGNSYTSVFHVTLGGVDYDWSNVADVILTIKKEKSSSTVNLQLKKTLGEIVCITGYMTLNLTTAKTNIPVGDYNCMELVIVFTGTNPKTWWDGKAKIKLRGTLIV